MMFFKALILSAALEAGFVSGSLFNYQNRNIAWNDIGALYTEIAGDVSSGPIYAGGSMICYFTPTAWNNYSPFQMTYVFGVGARVGNVQVGYEHSCYHPMQPYATIIGKEIKPKYEGGEDRFFVRIATNPKE